MDRERERHDDDTRRAHEVALRDRYTAIAAQLAHDSPAIRQAGVYALSALADDWHAFGEDQERQVCIDLLQWYLRVPFPGPDDSAKPDLPEREIRQTIVGIITERRHRPLDDPRSWASNLISLKQVSLPRCRLHVNFPDTDLTGADLTGADLSETNLVGANLSEATLAGADLTYANLYSAKLTRADFTHANLAGADLTYANLHGAKLAGADVSRAYLHRADLTAVDLAGTDLSEAYLADANLVSVLNSESAIWPDGLMVPIEPTSVPGPMSVAVEDNPSE
ncbi:pentapeptide repeat-containing protein [Nocardia abscessus]|uniref:pentapeptide repeat-containing protein n=1 Tax=Nocardia abscessus TaxID=120957 RepID=UPI0018951058|nr:pentapeptide repeat-containing protein [Nocardia abscessus]MBF6339178.1 pentapeptide repeat-containing protein [Nocardia abscessus]